LVLLLQMAAFRTRGRAEAARVAALAAAGGPTEPTEQQLLAERVSDDTRALWILGSCLKQSGSVPFLSFLPVVLCRAVPPLLLLLLLLVGAAVAVQASKRAASSQSLMDEIRATKATTFPLQH
jgi:hypothetical protein